MIFDSRQCKRPESASRHRHAENARITSMMRKSAVAVVIAVVVAPLPGTVDPDLDSSQYAKRNQADDQHLPFLTWSGSVDCVSTALRI